MGAGITNKQAKTTNKQKDSQFWQDAATEAYYMGNALAALSALCFASGLGSAAGIFFAAGAAKSYADAASYQNFSSVLKSKGR